MYRPTIFVVEDNLLYQAMIAKQLESLTDDIYFYTSGEACLADLDKLPNLVVLDQNLDGKLTGLDTLYHIKSWRPNTQVILFSNEAAIDSDENRQRFGGFDFLEKCIDSFPVLRDKVVHSLRNASLA